MTGLLLSSAETPTEEAHRLIDEAIERYMVPILALRFQRNTFAPISRLPPEILCEIFFMIARADQPEDMILDHNGRLAANPVTWVHLTHVCRHWRNIAIDTPTLWVRPPFRNISWVKEMLRRSKKANLVIEYNSESSSHPFPGLALALEHGQRIKYLSIDTTLSEWDESELEHMLPKSAPQLEFFRLATYYNNDPLIVLDLDDVLRETPKLRRLELSNIKADWHSHPHLLHTLTYLKLDNINPNSQLLTWKHFADALEGMPRLEVLDLDYSFPYVIHRENLSHNPSQPPVHLSASLRMLNIQAVAEDVETFLSCIILPPTAIVTIESYWEYEHEEPDFSDILTKLAQIYQNIEFQTLILLKPPNDLDLASPYPGIRLKLLTDLLTDKQMLTHTNIPARLELSFTWATHPRSLETARVVAAANTIFSSGPVQNIKRIYLPENPIHQFVPPMLANTIGKLKQLHSFMVAGKAGRILVEALKLGSPTEVTSPRDALHFPNLSSLYFHGARFDSKQESSAVPVDLLYDCLAQRSRSGAKLAKLKLKRCRNLLKADVRLLEEVVDNIDLDKDEDDEDM